MMEYGPHDADVKFSFQYGLSFSFLLSLQTFYLVGIVGKEAGLSR
jgi:hypothetical protein